MRKARLTVGFAGCFPVVFEKTVFILWLPDLGSVSIVVQYGSSAFMKNDFVHLHLHSEYSLLDGAIKFRDLVERVNDLNMGAVAITDHGNLFGAYEFHNEAKKKGR